MSNSLDIAEQTLLANTGLVNNDLENTLGQLMSHDIDYGDLFFEASRSESWVLEDGIVREGSHSIDQGVGIRAISGEKTGFAYSDEIILPALTQAARSARAIARSGGDGGMQSWQKSSALERISLLMLSRPRSSARVGISMKPSTSGDS